MARPRRKDFIRRRGKKPLYETLSFPRWVVAGGISATGIMILFAGNVDGQGDARPIRWEGWGYLAVVGIVSLCVLLLGHMKRLASGLRYTLCALRKAVLAQKAFAIKSLAVSAFVTHYTSRIGGIRGFRRMKKLLHLPDSSRNIEGG